MKNKITKKNYIFYRIKINTNHIMDIDSNLNNGSFAEVHRQHNNYTSTMGKMVNPFLELYKKSILIQSNNDKNKDDSDFSIRHMNIRIKLHRSNLTMPLVNGKNILTLKIHRYIYKLNKNI